MEMLQKITGAAKRSFSKLPKHAAFSMNGIESWALENKKSLKEANEKAFERVKELVEMQAELKIPVMTFYALSEKVDLNREFYDAYLDSLASFFEHLPRSKLVNENKVKVSVLGKWYHLPGKVIESIKNAIDGTKDYDSMFLNFCINYDGQEEMLDAFKIIAMQVKAGKMDPELIDKDLVKENLYSSYFIPPELIINNNRGKNTSLLLWDSVNAKVFHSKKLWQDIDGKEFNEALKWFEK
ncbi:di-trans,poly-cis-decaprenylcistransferase [Candidatus Woesearchaeota archaeon]|nr:di-trans,poly-cis-decaprenylcistransferase [Candidatus Woesearchaeota archaeon]